MNMKDFINTVVLVTLISGIFFLTYILKKYFKTGNKIPAIKEEKKQIKISFETLNKLISLAHENNIEFYEKFKEAHPYFYERLLQVSPKLSFSDLEYCALMRLNLDTKKIATIKRSSVGAIESKKYRIRKKLNISTEENIYIWLMDK